MLELNTIYNESCLTTLERMPDESIDCVVTSPPYYGLRSYGTEPQVWGNHNGCSHVWGDVLRNPKADPRSAELKKSQGATIGGTIHFNCETANGNSGNFCLNCNAWRGELGLEPTFQLYISHLIDIFREVKRVLKPTGTCFVNLGDSYAGSWGAMSHDLHGKGQKAGYNARPNTSRPQGIREKSLMNIPARFAIAMTDELGFIQRNEIIWHKPACMPSSAKDRFTVDFESIFFFTKSARYWFEQQLEEYRGEIRPRNEKPLYAGQNVAVPISRAGNGHDDGRNMRTVWRVNFEPQSEEHYASYPTKLIEIPIKAGCPPGGIVFDPFFGTGTTGIVAHKLGRKFIGSELQPKYAEIANKRLEPILAQSTLFDG